WRFKHYNQGNLVKVTQFSSHNVEVKKVSAYATNEDLNLKRKLLVLDINGLLADIVPLPVKDHKADKIIKRQAIFVRLFLHEFLKFCFDKFEVTMWSSRKRIVLIVLKHVSISLETRLEKSTILIFHGIRDITMNQINTLLLDDSPYKGLLNPLHTSVFPHTFSYKNTGDNSLAEGGDLRKYLDELANVEDMQKYVEKHPMPFGQGCINETSEYWDFYLKVVKNCHRTFKKNNNTYNSHWLLEGEKDNVGEGKEESDSEAKRELIGSIEENDREVKHEIEDYETLMERKEIN
ncbi:hypothetical protein CR513_40370, partial [Mucuna pruriens]